MNSNLQNGITQFWFLLSTHHLMVLCICIKFCENIFNSSKVMKWIKFNMKNLQKGIKSFKIDALRMLMGMVA